MSWTVPCLWPGSTVACIGSGPSLTAADAELLCASVDHVIAVNNAIALCPDADILYAGDEQWWRWYSAKYRSFSGLRVACTDASRRWGVDHIVALEEGDGISCDPQYLRAGKTGGYHALNLAVLLGAVRICLLGYDMTAPDGGPQHFFGDHPLPGKVSRWEAYRKPFDTVVEPLRALGVTVANCSRETALTCFPRMTIEEAVCVTS